MTTCSTGSPRGYSATRNNSSTQLNSQKDTAVSRTVSAGSSVAVRSAALGAGHAARAGSGRAAQEELAKLREQYAKLGKLCAHARMEGAVHSIASTKARCLHGCRGQGSVQRVSASSQCEAGTSCVARIKAAAQGAAGSADRSVLLQRSQGQAPGKHLAMRLAQLSLVCICLHHCGINKRTLPLHPN
jgi:hypothetical protein